MQPMVPRTTLITAAALGAALIWGTVEFLALQWCRLMDRVDARGSRPTS